MYFDKGTHTEKINPSKPLRMKIRKTTLEQSMSGSFARQCMRSCNSRSISRVFPTHFVRPRPRPEVFPGAERTPSPHQTYLVPRVPVLRDDARTHASILAGTMHRRALESAGVKCEDVEVCASAARRDQMCGPCEVGLQLVCLRCLLLILTSLLSNRCRMRSPTRVGQDAHDKATQRTRAPLNENLLQILHELVVVSFIGVRAAHNGKVSQIRETTKGRKSFARKAPDAWCVEDREVGRVSREL